MENIYKKNTCLLEFSEQIVSAEPTNIRTKIKTCFFFLLKKIIQIKLLVFFSQ
jgi:hypothetical protein